MGPTAQVAPAFFTAITKTEDYCPGTAGASETFRSALAQAGCWTAAGAGAVVEPALSPPAFDEEPTFGAEEEPPAGVGLEEPEEEAPPGAEVVPVPGAPEAVEGAPAVAALGELEEHPVAATATRTPPARSAMVFSRFMPG